MQMTNDVFHDPDAIDQGDDDAEIAAVTFSKSASGNDVTLEIRGDLDIAAARLLSRELDDVLDAATARVGVALSGVEFMDSSALSALVRARERARKDGRHLELVNPSPACAKVLSITGLDRVFEC
jgi:anti-sigma B factor antagonist